MISKRKSEERFASLYSDQTMKWCSKCGETRIIEIENFCNSCERKIANLYKGCKKTHQEILDNYMNKIRKSWE